MESEKLMLLRKLMHVQSELKAPKNLLNKFGGYKYRNTESILEAVKPLLEKYELILTISDSIEMIGDRFYLVATATIAAFDGASYSIKAYAREPEDKKGMDASQITGTSSSYARKYALNGLFLIDDTKDADADDVITKQNIETVESNINLYKMDKSKILNEYQIKNLSDMRITQFKDFMTKVEKYAQKSKDKSIQS